MFDKPFLSNAIQRSAENEADRRKFLRTAGAAGLGVLGGGYLASTPAAHASRFGNDFPFGDDDDPFCEDFPFCDHDKGPSDAAILNFALNLEYLEAEFYVRAVTGEGLPENLTRGKGERGPVAGGSKVPFETSLTRGYALEIAEDEKSHVAFLRQALGDHAVARPKINLQQSFTAAARAAGLIGQGQTFDPFANETNFLLAAFIFEDVGVTAYKGASPLIDNKTFLEAAAGILAVEAYHAGNIRTALASRGAYDPTVAISKARDSLDNTKDDDQGVFRRGDGRINIVPSDNNGIAFSRTPGDVLNIVYLTPDKAKEGGFFPEGVNGKLNTSSAKGSN